MKKIHIKTHGLHNLPIGLGVVQIRCPVTLQYTRDLEMCAKSFRLNYEIIDDVEQIQPVEDALPDPVEAPADLNEASVVDEDDEILAEMSELEEEAEQIEEVALPSLTELSNMRKADLVDLAAQLGLDFEGSREALLDRIRESAY